MRRPFRRFFQNGPIILLVAGLALILIGQILRMFER